MRILFFIFLLGGLCHTLLAQPPGPSTKPVLYLIPGQGADARLYNRFAITGYDTVRLQWLEPKKKESMAEFAARMAKAIDTTRPVILVGVSLGGMVSAEISHIIPVEAVVFISSAKTKKELPLRYRFMKVLPLYRIFSGNFYKKATPRTRRIVEPGSRENSEFFDAMIADKTANFMKQSVRMIVQWKRKNLPAVPYLHLHGSHDRTLPFRRINNAEQVARAGHMMVYSNAQEVYTPVQTWLDEFCANRGWK